MVFLWDKSKGQTLNNELEPGTESRSQSENNIEERVSLGNRSRESLRDRTGEKLSIGKSDSFPCPPPPAPRPRNTSLASPVSSNGAEIPRWGPSSWLAQIRALLAGSWSTPSGGRRQWSPPCPPTSPVRGPSSVWCNNSLCPPSLAS